MSKKLRQSPSTAFMVNLLVCLLPVCAFGMPMYGVGCLQAQQYGDVTFSKGVCLTFFTLGLILSQVRIHSICALAFNSEIGQILVQNAGCRVPNVVQASDATKEGDALLDHTMGLLHPTLAPSYLRGKRENNSHIDCGCPREKKIPVLELEFIKAQRTKAEGQGSMQMGSIDYSETKKQIANAKKREQIREREQKKKMKSEEAIQREEELCQDVYHFFDSSSDEQEATSDDSSKEPSEPLPKKMKYNTRNISNIALASIRHHAGLREAAEIATAAWIDAGLISREDVSLVARAL
ncbi:putative trapped in endoderm-1-like 2, partial [Homarus americanus]